MNNVFRAETPSFEIRYFTCRPNIDCVFRSDRSEQIGDALVGVCCYKKALITVCHLF
jgi:hypothetical protein